MKVVYVAGRYRGKGEDEVYEHIHLARTHAKALWKAGYIPLVPHMNSAFMGGVVEDAVFLEGAMELLRRCDFIYLLPNWIHSSGTLKELLMAQKLGVGMLVKKGEGVYGEEKI